MRQILDRIAWAGFALCATLLVLMFSGVVGAGPLDPDDPPGPTMKTLAEIEPRTAISQADIPLTISESGSYYLTENLGPATGAAINILANNVAIDLNGFTMASTGAGNAIEVQPGFQPASIRNGTIRGWFFGVSAIGSQVLISDVSFYGNAVGVYGNAGSVVEDCSITNSTIRAVALIDYGLVQRCMFYNNAVGVEFFGHQNTVRDNTFVLSGTLSIKYAESFYISNIVIDNRFNCPDMPVAPAGNFQPLDSNVDHTNHCLPF